MINSTAHVMIKGHGITNQADLQLPPWSLQTPPPENKNPLATCPILFTITMTHTTLFLPRINIIYSLCSQQTSSLIKAPVLCNKLQAQSLTVSLTLSVCVFSFFNDVIGCVRDFGQLNDKNSQRDIGSWYDKTRCWSCFCHEKKYRVLENCQWVSVVTWETNNSWSYKKVQKL